MQMVAALSVPHGIITSDIVATEHVNTDWHGADGQSRKIQHLPNLLHQPQAVQRHTLSTTMSNFKLLDPETVRSLMLRKVETCSGGSSCSITAGEGPAPHVLGALGIDDNRASSRSHHANRPWLPASTERAILAAPYSTPDEIERLLTLNVEELMCHTSKVQRQRLQHRPPGHCHVRKASATLTEGSVVLVDNSTGCVPDFTYERDECRQMCTLVRREGHLDTELLTPADTSWPSLLSG